jgi:hypothetical protein
MFDRILSMHWKLKDLGSYGSESRAIPTPNQPKRGTTCKAARSCYDHKHSSLQSRQVTCLYGSKLCAHHSHEERVSDLLGGLVEWLCNVIARDRRATRCATGIAETRCATGLAARPRFIDMINVCCIGLPVFT